MFTRAALRRTLQPCAMYRLYAGQSASFFEYAAGVPVRSLNVRRHPVQR
jgi:hypothetical protein